ncbi:MAG TPA: hypothetical protein VFV07_13040, partial [Rhizomicrobium sp.]|nr:hypothetical protein [Rhizomicrobium sp.]
DVTHMPPLKHPRRFLALMFGCAAAPIFWLGQLGLSYWVTAQACYGADHPTMAASAGALRGALIAFDAVAIIAGLAGLLSAVSLRRLEQERARFMAHWGIFSSLCFLAAIVFNAVASIMVPLCAR